MITNNTLQKLIENEQFQLPEEYLCSRATTKNKGNYEKLNINIESIVSRYHNTRYMRVGERETFEETYRKNTFIPYLRILDLIKKYELLTCLQIDCNKVHLMYLARQMNIDYFGFNNTILPNEKQIFIDTFQHDCLVNFELNNLQKLNHCFDVILCLKPNYDESAFKHLLRIFSNKSQFAIVNVSNNNYSLLKRYNFLEELEYFNTESLTKIVLLRFKGKLDIDLKLKFNDQNNIVGLSRI